MDVDNKKMYTYEKRAITKLNRIKFLYVTLPVLKTNICIVFFWK